MARKPADEMHSPREAMWASLRRIAASGAHITVARIVEATQTNRKSVSDYLDALTSGGFLQRLPDLPNKAKAWALVRDIGVEAPRVRKDGTEVTQGRVTEQLWRGMCILKEFSFMDLVETATIEIPVETAKAYCKVLLATGYLRVIQKAAPNKARIARYRLVRNNGPRPPQVQRVKQIYDPNTREVFAVESGS